MKGKNAISQMFSDIFIYKENTSDYNFILPETDSTNSCSSNTANSTQNEQDTSITSNYNKNLEFLKIKYNSLINSDVVIKNFDLVAMNKKFSAFIVYIDGMINTDTINCNILKPLMLKNLSNIGIENTSLFINNKHKNSKSNNSNINNLLDLINLSLLPQNAVTIEDNFSSIISGINSGNCALFVDTLDKAFNIDVTGFKERSNGNPQNQLC